VQIIADTIQFLGSRSDGEGGGAGGGGNQFVPAGAAQESADFPAAADDDIPF
jgi:single-stranded DNA-binding protein